MRTKTKMFVAMITVCLLILLTACGSAKIVENYRADKAPDNNSPIIDDARSIDTNNFPYLIRYDVEKSVGYNFLVDSRTGVVYLEYGSLYRYGLTVMLNADGTPVTADQIGLEVN